jgi:hypothetical protein
VTIQMQQEPFEFAPDMGGSGSGSEDGIPPMPPFPPFPPGPGYPPSLSYSSDSDSEDDVPPTPPYPPFPPSLNYGSGSDSEDGMPPMPPYPPFPPGPGYPPPGLGSYPGSEDGISPMPPYPPFPPGPGYPPNMGPYPYPESALDMPQKYMDEPYEDTNQSENTINGIEYMAAFIVYCKKRLDGFEHLWNKMCGDDVGEEEYDTERV